MHPSSKTKKKMQQNNQAMPADSTVLFSKVKRRDPKRETLASVTLVPVVTNSPRPEKRGPFRYGLSRGGPDLEGLSLQKKGWGEGDPHRLPVSTSWPKKTKENGGERRRFEEKKSFADLWGCSRGRTAAESKSDGGEGGGKKPSANLVEGALGPRGNVLRTVRELSWSQSKRPWANPPPKGFRTSNDSLGKLTEPAKSEGQERKVLSKSASKGAFV